MKSLIRYSLISFFLLLGISTYAQPNANFTTSKTEGCSPFIVQFNSAEQGSGFKHDWNFGNGIINNGPINPSRTYTATGTYTVTHTITSSNGTKTETKTNYITVHPSPVADFTAPNPKGCPPLTLNFTDKSTSGTSGSLTHSWVFTGGNPNTSSTQNPTVIYNNPGLYNVTLKVTNSKGCTHSVTKNTYVEVLSKPVVDFTADQAIFCSAPAKVNFKSNITGGTTPYNYAWALGVGSSNAQDPGPINYPGPAPAQYNISLTVIDANGCSGTSTKAAFIKILDVKAAFTAPTTVCPNAVFGLTNNSTSGSTPTWDMGDGNQITGNNPNYSYSTPGTYNIKLTSRIGNCDDVATKTITVRPKPNPAVIQAPKFPCPAPQTINFSTNPAMSSYDWVFQNTGGVQTSTSATPQQTYTKSLPYPYELRVVDASGCKDTVKGVVDILDVDPLTTVNTFKGGDSGCTSKTFKFLTELVTSAGDPYPHDIKTVLWKFGDGNSITTTAKPHGPSHAYADSGRYTVLLEIETVNGCKLYDTLQIAVGYKPVIHDIFANYHLICPKTKVDFQAWVDGYSPLIYEWEFGDGGSSRKIDDTTTEHVYGCNDSFTVKLEVQHNGCKSEKMVKDTFIISLPPCASFISEPVCSNMLSVKFTNLSEADSTWIWHFGDGNTSTVREPTHTYATRGTYNVTLVAYNSTSGCKDSMTLPVLVGNNPPIITASRTTLCKGGYVAFNSSLKYPSNVVLNYYWYINDIPVNLFPSFTHQFNTPGQYTVKLVVETFVGLCRDSVVQKDFITVGGPYSGFKTDVREVCEPGSITFTDTSHTGAGTYVTTRRWNFNFGAPNDTITEYTGTTQHKYNKKGPYDIYLITTDNLGCKDTLYRQDYIKVKKPVAAFSVNAIVCANDNILFVNNSQDANTYEWNFGNGNTATTEHPSNLYKNRSNYNVRLIAIDGLGCRDTISKPITTTKPYADFTISDSMSICPPLITKVDGKPSVGAKSYLWRFDDGTGPGTNQSHTVVYNDQKEYNIRLVVTDTVGCKDTAFKSVQVLGYSGAFSYSPLEGCVPLTVNFQSKVKGTVPTMIWDFGDGNTQLGSQQQQNITYTYKTPGKYIPRIVFNNNQGCIVGSDGLDTVLVDGVIPDFETGPACQFSTVEFINKSTSEITALTGTKWTFHDGTTSEDADTEKKYGPPGKYSVKLVAVNSRGCIDSIEKEITINTPIEMYAGADTVICLTDSVQLSPTGGVSYMWSPPGSLSCLNCNNPYAFPKVKTKYTVISTDINGCHDTTSLEVGIKTHVTSIVGDGGEICEGEEFVLSVTGARTYLWSPAADLNDATSPSPIATPRTNTKYKVIAYEGRCIPDTSFVDVTVHPKPTVVAKEDKTIVAGTTADLIASGTNIVRFLWSPSNTLSCSDCSDPVAKPYKTTKYTVKVFTKFECVDSAFVNITVLCDESQLFVPNTFTPNGDGMNDIFMVRGTGISSVKTFRVYTRWGEVVFNRGDVMPNDKANGWDGTYNGSQLPPDVYVYIVEAFCENGDLLKLKGDVTIIR